MSNQPKQTDEPDHCDATVQHALPEQSRQGSKTPSRIFYREPSDGTDRAAHAVIGAAIEVHRHLGPGHLEIMYERALVIELELRKIQFERQVRSRLEYKGLAIGELRLDLVIDDRVIVELKTVESLSSTHVSQCLAYLALTRMELALLINFNVAVLHQGLRRIVPRHP